MSVGRRSVPGMDFIPFLSTFFGSAGLMSVVVAIIKRSRQSKARRFLEDAKVAKETVDPASHSSAVLDQAIATTTLRLAASTFWVKSAGQRAAIAIVISVVSLFAAMTFAVVVARIVSTDGEPDTIYSYIGLLIFFILYFGGAASAVVYLERWGREQWFYKELLRIPIVVETAEIRRARAARKRQRKAARRQAKWIDRKWTRARKKVEACRSTSTVDLAASSAFIALKHDAGSTGQASSGGDLDHTSSGSSSVPSPRSSPSMAASRPR